LSKTLENFYVILFYGLEILSVFWKIMERFSKKYGHLKSKIIHKFHYILFVFLFY